MDIEKAKKVFPAYFESFELPSAAREQEIEVYRACRTGRIERASFLNSYEENGCRISADGSVDDPQEYCVSTYFRLNDVKRFVILDSKYQPPWLLAKGHTTKEDGLSCKSREWKKCKNSHVDWWLYIGAEPWLAFEEVSYDDELRKISAQE